MLMPVAQAEMRMMESLSPDAAIVPSNETKRYADEARTGANLTGLYHALTRRCWLPGTVWTRTLAREPRKRLLLPPRHLTRLRMCVREGCSAS